MLASLININKYYNGNQVLNNVSLTIDSGAGSGKVIGLAVSAGAEIALTGGAAKPNAGEPVQITFWADELPGETVPVTPMTVETVEADDDTGEIIVTAHDAMRTLEKHTVSEITVEYPTTIGRYAAALTATAGLELTAQDWIGAETILSAPPNFSGTETCRAALAAIAETAFGNAYIDRDGKIIIRSVAITGEAYAIAPDNYFSCSIGSAWGPINTLVLGREPQGDNIYREDSTAVVKHGRIALQISDNPFLDSIRDDVIDDMFAHINGTVIQPYELDFRGDPALDPGDAILLTDTNGVQRAAVYGAQTLEFDGGLRVAVNMNAPSNATADYTKAANVKESVRRVSLSVDKVKGEIAAEVSRATEAEKELSAKITVTAEGIESKVSKDDIVSAINQSAEAVKIKASKIELVSADGTVSIDLTNNEVTITGGEGLNTDYGVDWMRKSKIVIAGGKLIFCAEKSPDDLTMVPLAAIGLDGNGLYIEDLMDGNRGLFVACNGGNSVVLGSEKTLTVIDGAYINIGENAYWMNSDMGYDSEGYYDGSGFCDFGGMRVCWGQMLVKYAATTASGAHYYGDSTSISGGTFKRTFYDAPRVSLIVRQATTAVLGLEAVDVSATGINTIRVHRATNHTDTSGLLVDYIAVGF